MRRVILRLNVEQERRGSSILEQLADLIAEDKYLSVYTMQTGEDIWWSEAAWRNEPRR